MTEFSATSNAVLASDLARLARDPGLRAFMGGDAAVMLIASEGGEVVHGNAAGLAMARAGFAGRTAAQFARLAAGLAPANGVRLEQIELPSAHGSVAMTCACRRIRADDGRMLLLIAAQDRSRRAEGAAPASAPEPEQAPATGGSAALLDAPAEAPLRKALPPKARFIWEMDAEGRIAAPAEDIAIAFGPGAAAAASGQVWASLAETVVDDPDGAVASALASGKTFSGLATYWRIDASGESRKVTMSGIPLADGGGVPAGWRGFGIIDMRQVVPFAPALADAPAVAEAAPEAHAIADEAQEEEAQALHEPASDLTSDDEAAHASDGGTPASAEPPMPWEDEPPKPAALSPGEATHNNVVQIRPHDPGLRLTSSERNAFREIAKALGARLDGDEAAADALGQSASGYEAGDLPSDANADAAPAEVQADEAESPSAAADADAAATGAASYVGEEATADYAGPAPDMASDSAGPGAERGMDARAAQAPVQAGPLAPATLDRVVHLVPPPPRDNMFMALLDKLPIGILVLKSDRIIYANRTLVDLLDHDSVDGLLDAGPDKVFRGAVPSEGGGVFTLARRDGGLEPVDARLSSITWNGAAATLMSFRRAVETHDAARTEALKLDVEKAQAQARELVAILDTATDGVATVDDRGRILSLNRSAEALFGYDQREVTGENFTLLLAPESHITALDYLEGLKGGGVASLLNDGREVQGRVRQGGRIPLFMTMGRVADGAEKKYSAVLRDMTAWKRAEADLVEARREAEKASAQKSDVLAKISHEIRTPLNAILGFTEVMSEERFGPIGNERYKEYLGDIHQSGGYLISLINDLLDLAKIEAGKMDLTFVGVNLNDVASSSVALLQPEANRQRVVLRTGLQPKLPAVVADDRSLRQIVINVLSNAVKFTDAGGQVIVSTALGDRGEVILRVRDTGVGMSEKELALAMEPFRQVSSTRRGTGTGLGLPITKALVEANKGALLITSAKNEGTLVEITFPPQRVLAS